MTFVCVCVWCGNAWITKLLWLGWERTWSQVLFRDILNTVTGVQTKVTFGIGARWMKCAKFCIFQRHLLTNCYRDLAGVWRSECLNASSKDTDCGCRCHQMPWVLAREWPPVCWGQLVLCSGAVGVELSLWLAREPDTCLNSHGRTLGWPADCNLFRVLCKTWLVIKRVMATADLILFS